MIFYISFLGISVLVLGLLIWNKRRLRTSKDSIEADAIVLSIRLSGVCIKEEIQAVVQLQVQPERGKSFVSETRKMLSVADYMKLQPGSRIRVQFFGKNRKELNILNVSLTGEPRSAAGIIGRQSVLINK